MQTLGTEWGREKIHPDLWLRATERRVGRFDKVVISDIRFHNEVEMVHRLGGTVYRIDRPNGAGVDSHPSEGQIDHLKVDHVVVNDSLTAANFAKRARLSFG